MRKERRKWRVWLQGFLGVLLLSVITGTTFGITPTNTEAAEEKSPAVREWLGSWAASPQYPSRVALQGVSNRTVRLIVHPHMDGSKMRVRLSNAFGEKPVTFDEVIVARTATGAAVVPDTNRRVTFGGEKGITIPVGGEAVSDPVPYPVKKGEDVTVSLYLSGESGPATWHRIAKQTSYISEAGNYAADSVGSAFTERITSWFWLVGIDVIPRPGAEGAIVSLGNSITDGTRSTDDTNHRYPDFLVERLDGAGIAKSVLNAGISGNKVLKDDPVYGESTLKRLERDVLNQPGVTDVIVLQGINDIGHEPHNYDADSIIAGLQEIIDRAHERGLRVYGGTLTPYEGTTIPGYYTEEGEAARQKVNHWIRTGGAFDGVIDFDKALRDPGHPTRLLPTYDSGDHLHPNDAGYRAMAEAIDLDMLK